ncbi:DNA transfer protein [Phage f2b1]|nr:DNA transfer protein [Phage f2b1]
MAKNEPYIFDVDAETGKAVQKLQQIAQLMDKIEGIHGKAKDNYSVTNQKDMDKNMRAMTQLTKLYKEVDRDLANIQRKMRDMNDSTIIPEGATEDQRREIAEVKKAMEDQARAAVQQQRLVRNEYTKTLKQFRDFSNFRQNYSKGFESPFNSKDRFNLPAGAEQAKSLLKNLVDESDAVSKKLNEVKDKIQEVNKLDRRSESLSRRAEASKYMSFQQAKSFSKDYKTASQDYTVEKDTNLDRLQKLGQERGDLTRKVRDIQGNPSATPADVDRKIAYQESIRAIDAEMEQRMELNRVLNRTISNMEAYNRKLAEENKIQVKPERGTFRGMMYERAPAIGLAFGGAAAATVGSLYSRGASINQSIRDDVISMGQHTGTEGANWRSSIRDNALEMGLSDRLGFTGQDMLNFQQGYMANNGYEGMDDLNSAAKNQAVFSRSVGVDAATTSDFFSSAFQTGAVNGSQVRDIRDAFVGAIKQSGMEGREKEQLKTLQGLLGSVSRGRTMTNDEVMNVMGMQSVLAQSGERSLQGEQGGQLMQGLNEGIRQGFEDPMVRLVFGQGTKYQGIEGRHKLRAQMDKGISDPENLQNIAQYAMSKSNSTDGQNEYFASFVQSKLGVDITAEQSDALMKLARKGDFSQESINKVLGEDKKKGGEEGDKKLKEYQNSHESIDNQSEATTDKQATQLYDFGEAIRKANSSLGGIPPVAYAAVVALGALAVAAAGAAASFGMSALFRKGMADTFGGKGRRGGGNGGGGWFGRNKNKPDGTKPPTGEKQGFFSRAKDTVGGWFGGNKDKPDVPKPKSSGSGEPKGNWFSRSADKVKGWGAAGWEKSKGVFGSIKDKFKGGGGGTSGVVESAGGMKGALGKAGGILGKVALPVSILAGVGSILAADPDKKGEATGAAAGGILGGMGGGAAAGAALGSVVPGLGTVIGGIGGSIVGGIAGSGIGGWIGSKFDGGGKTPEEVAAAKDKQGKEGEKEVKNQIDRENTNTKHRAENKRGDNISQERELLKYYENLLNRAQQLLDQARSQNGIFGSQMTGGGVVDGSGGGAASPVVGNSNAEKAWNFFAGKGMSAGAIAGILGNLQQESQIDPTAPNGGLAQWLGPRREALNNYAKQSGGDVNSMETQLNFLWKELESGQFGSIDELNKLNPTEAAKYFEEHFEKAGKPMMEKRINYANQWYNQYGSGGTPQMKTNAGTSSSSNTNNNNVKVNSNINVKVSGDESVSQKVKDSKELNGIAKIFHDKIYGSMQYHSKDTERA